MFSDFERRREGDHFHPPFHCSDFAHAQGSARPEREPGAGTEAKSHRVGRDPAITCCSRDAYQQKAGVGGRAGTQTLAVILYLGILGIRENTVSL